MDGYLRVFMALSVAGMVILPLIGVLLHYQPRFVHGLHVDAAKAERNCYIATACYGGTFLLCAAVLYIRGRNRQQAGSGNGMHMMSFPEHVSKDSVKMKKQRDEMNDTTMSEADISGVHVAESSSGRLDAL